MTTSGVSPAASLGAIAYLSFSAATGAGAVDPASYYFANETIPLPVAADVRDRLVLRSAWMPIVSAMKAFAYEDGMNHPAEGALARFVREHGDTSLVGLLRDDRKDDPALFATSLRLLSRIAEITPETRRQLVHFGLASDDLDLRDAAMQAVENWRDRTLAPMLAAHREPVAWLADYQQGIIEDLAG